MGVLFALCAAGAYGVSDFLGGLASRRSKPLTVLLYNYPAGAIVMAALLTLFPGHVSLSTLLWSMLGGAGGMWGVALLYMALADAPMNVISPIAGVLSGAVPVLFGVITGERPSALAWTGILLGLASVILICRSPQHPDSKPVTRRSVTMAIGAGVAFGVYFICLARGDSDSGLWPVVIARVTASILIIPVALRGRAFGVLRGRLMVLPLLAGVIDSAANLTFLLATRDGYLSIASVITALYPAGTVLLAIGVLKGAHRLVAANRTGVGRGRSRTGQPVTNQPLSGGGKCPCR